MRLHDCGHKGVWWLLLLVPAVNVFALFYLLLMPPQPFTNPYGPNRP
ncbi:MAG: DUF805 domain-containing protein [Duodenibacillus sp.]|nr:DUF805 domain-containing protein [Duodenibacillus sp.]